MTNLSLLTIAIFEKNEINLMSKENKFEKCVPLFDSNNDSH